MRGFALGISLSFAFILGCLSAPYLVPSASAQNASRARFQYYCIEGSSSEARLTEILNDRASRGWELVTGAGDAGNGSQSQWCLRRATGR